MPVLHGVVSWWHGPQLALARDATTVGPRGVVLAIRVVDRGCAIAGAWVVLSTTEQHAWRRDW
jgi:hypothetical protein